MGGREEAETFSNNKKYNEMIHNIVFEPSTLLLTSDQSNILLNIKKCNSLVFKKKLLSKNILAEKKDNKYYITHCYSCVPSTNSSG